MKNQKQIAGILKTARLNLKLSMRDVEKISGVSRGYISQIETGKRGMPALKTLKILCEAYGLFLEDILDLNVIESTPAEYSHIISILSKLNEHNRDNITSYARFLLTEQRQK